MTVLFSLSYVMLQASIAYEQDDLATVKAMLPPLPIQASSVAPSTATSGSGGSKRSLLGVGGPVVVPRGGDAAALSGDTAGGGDPSLLISHGCLAYKEGRMDDARAHFEAAAARYAPQYRVSGCRLAIVVHSTLFGARGGALSIPSATNAITLWCSLYLLACPFILCPAARPCI